MTSVAGSQLTTRARTAGLLVGALPGLFTTSPATTSLSSSSVAVRQIWAPTRGADVALAPAASRHVEAAAPKTSDLVRQLHDESGLTWEQLAKLFWVSRRAVHHWAVGGTMNAANIRRLNQLLGIVRQLPGTSAAEKRAAIFTPGDNGRSRYDQLLKRSSADAINAPLPPESLVGARHD